MRKIIKISAIVFLCAAVAFFYRHEMDYSLLSSAMLFLMIYVNMLMDENDYFKEQESRSCVENLEEVDGEYYSVIDFTNRDEMFDRMANADEEIVKR